MTNATNQPTAKQQAAANRAYADMQVETYQERIMATDRHSLAYQAALDCAKDAGAEGPTAVAAAKQAASAFAAAYKAAVELGQNTNQATSTAANTIDNPAQGLRELLESQPTAAQVYATKQAAIATQLETLRDLLATHAAGSADRPVNWADVGDLSQVENQLDLAINFMLGGQQ